MSAIPGCGPPAVDAGEGLDSAARAGTQWKQGQGATRAVGQEREVECGTTLGVIIAIAAVVLSTGMATWAFRGLYDDGAYYLFRILADANFFHPSKTRISATYLTQYPLVVAVKLGLNDMRLLARLYTATLFGVPTMAYVVSTWSSRKDPLLLTINLCFIAAVFYTTNFIIIGEFHILYSLYWCAFVLLITGRCDRLLVVGMLPLIGLALCRSYEISVILCPILSLACLWRTKVSKDRATRAILVLSACVFASGAWFGLVGGLFPASPDQRQGFVSALFNPVFYTVPIEIVVLFAVAATGGLTMGWRRLVVGACVLMASAGFVWWRISHTNMLSLGPPYDQRAAVVPVILGLSFLATIRVVLPGRLPRLARLPVLFPLLPAAAVFAIDLHDTISWKNYLNGFCESLSPTTSAVQRHAFLVDRLARKVHVFKWPYASMSVLLRPVGSQAMVADPDLPWQPFDPTSPPSNLSAYKTNGGICGKALATSFLL